MLVAVAAPSFFSAANLRDLALNNAPVLLVAVGMTLVILVGEIDISVGVAVRGVQRRGGDAREGRRADAAAAARRRSASARRWAR